MQELKTVCANPWCKATFFYKEEDMTVLKSDGEEVKVSPKVCHKCKSFDNELSGGISWEERKYEGDPWSGAQRIKYNVTNYK